MNSRCAEHLDKTKIVPGNRVCWNCNNKLQLLTDVRQDQEDIDEEHTKEEHVEGECTEKEHIDHDAHDEEHVDGEHTGKEHVDEGHTEEEHTDKVFEITRI